MPSSRHGLLIAAIVMLASGEALASVEDGVQKWRAGDYAGAIAEWQKPADKGDRDAQFNLGQAYKLGRGVPADTGKAIALYRKAAAQGHEPAEANLGWLLFQNGQRDEAMPLLQRAATRGDAHSQYLLGIAYFNGDAVPRDWPRAYRLMNTAAASGLPQAKDALLSMDARMPLIDRQKALLAEPAAPPEKTGKPDKIAATQPPPSPSARPLQPAPSQPPAPRPVTTPAVTAPPATAAPGDGWRVQLGAFSNRKAAATAWTALSGKLKALGALTPHYETRDRIVRLQAGPLPDRKSAAGLCGKVASAGGSCFPTRP